MMALSKLSWQGPTQYVDGSAFGQSDLAGFQVTVDGLPAVDIPMAWNTANVYTVDFKTLGLKFGQHTASVATVAKNGTVSVQSNSVTFTYADTRAPNPPTNLQAA